MSAYTNLETVFRKAAAIGDALSILQWDMATMMPDGGAEGRGEQLATLKGMAHELITQPRMAELFESAAGEGLDPWQAANLREMRREWIHAGAVPPDLVEALSRAEGACEMVWREARRVDDFKMVAPKLKELLGLVRQVGAIKAEKLGVGIYDALLDQYEPDGRSAEIDPVFAHLEGVLPGLIEEALAAQDRREPPLPLDGLFPISAQKSLGLKLMGVLGFDFHHGRLDVSHHPFCGGTPYDTRITTRYDETDFFPAMMGVLHETGHALYEFGLPKAPWQALPVGRARGMVAHESQSLLMEMQACRSRAFLGYVAPVIRDILGQEGPAWQATNLYARAIRVKRGFIRVEADEVTYPAHVIIRYRLEKALIEGRMELDDLPGAWNDGYRRLLGITPPDNRLGCLQDIHWYGGSWGYFPTYTLGAMTAAQLFDAATKADADIMPGIGRGDFAPLLAWLRTNIHAKGSLLSTRDLLIQATGRPLDPAVFETHLKRRYLS
jgi:carboxypeptidase Taq